MVYKIPQGYKNLFDNKEYIDTEGDKLLINNIKVSIIYFDMWEEITDEIAIGKYYLLDLVYIV